MRNRHRALSDPTQRFQDAAQDMSFDADTTTKSDPADDGHISKSTPTLPAMHTIHTPGGLSHSSRRIRKPKISKAELMRERDEMQKSLEDDVSWLAQDAEWLAEAQRRKDAMLDETLVSGKIAASGDGGGGCERDTEMTDGGHGWIP